MDRWEYIKGLHFSLILAATYICKVLSSSKAKTTCQLPLPLPLSRISSTPFPRNTPTFFLPLPSCGGGSTESTSSACALNALLLGRNSATACTLEGVWILHGLVCYRVFTRFCLSRPRRVLVLERPRRFIQPRRWRSHRQVWCLLQHRQECPRVCYTVV